MRRALLLAFLFLAAAPASAGAVAEFVAQCPYSHRAPDDPIVFPKMPGASHSHDFFGSKVTNARTTSARTLARGATTCRPRADRSGYWVPTLYVGGQAVRPIRGTFYYQSTLDDTSAIRPYPAGLKLLAGNAKATRPPPDKDAIWGCLGTGTGGLQSFPDCGGAKLELLIDFPECWDGRHRDAADHKSHMAYPVDHKCPRSHPVAVPRLEFKLTYATAGGAGAMLSSGAAFTAHGDFFDAWNRRALAQRIKTCLVPKVKCGANGRRS